ncbi:Flp pilus assembly complex ATPase component TadA [bacterium]|nr:Flp pilus assembly complex ATPase component TadA [bacterium]
MQSLPKTRLGDMLVAAGVLTGDQLDWALEKQKQNYKRLGQILLEAELASEDDIAEARALQLEMPHIQLGEYPIASEVTRLVPESIARTYTLVPVSVSNEKLAVAMSNPMDVEAIDAVARSSRMRVEPLLASEARIMATLDQVYGGSSGDDITASIEEAVCGVDIQIQENDLSNDIAEERRQSGQAPVIKTVNLVLQEAVKQHASDIHLEPRANHLEIRYRIDGALQHIRNLPKAIQPAVISRIKIMSELDIAEKRKPQDGRIALRVHNKNIDLRISTLPVQYGERVVMRVLDKSAQQFSVEKLGFAEQEHAVFESLIRKPHGIILVTGPTGSGKTTTLYAALTHIKSEDTNIMTCEDPIEYELDGINQSAVNVKAGLTFAAQLRAILRQDPDVILVGEIRDGETAEVAFQAAMTGHLVFSTLHCNTAPSAITRLVDMGVESFLIGSSVIGVLAQRLVRTLCPRCKSPYKPTIDELALLGIEDIDEKAEFYKPVGCPQCNMRGYSGRLAIFELMPVNEEMRRLALHNPTADQVRDVAVAAGMRSMKDHAVEKIMAGLTTIDEVRRKVFVEDE